MIAKAKALRPWETRMTKILSTHAVSPFIRNAAIIRSWGAWYYSIRPRPIGPWSYTSRATATYIAAMSHKPALYATCMAGLLTLSGNSARASDTAYVSNERANTISVVDVGSGKVTATWTTGHRPRGIVVTPDGKYVLVAVGQDSAVEMRDAATGALITSLPSGQDPEQIFLTRDGTTLFASNEDDAAAPATAGQRG